MCVVSSNFCYALHPVVSLALYIEMEDRRENFRTEGDKNARRWLPNCTKQAFKARVDWLAFRVGINLRVCLELSLTIRSVTTKQIVYTVDIPGPRVDKETRNASIAQKRKKKQVRSLT